MDTDDSRVWILGSSFDCEELRTTAFCLPQEQSLSIEDRVQSLILCTYRKNCPDICGSGYKTDAGWGCMLRTAQMMLAQAISANELGREWKYNPPHEDKKHNDILSLFIDAAEMQFSIQKLNMCGMKYGTKPGIWFGPNTVTLLLRDLFDEYNNISAHKNENRMVCVLCDEGVVYSNKVLYKSKFGYCRTYHSSQKPEEPEIIDDEEWSHPVMLMVPLRLGVDKLNPIYYNSLLSVLEMKECVGFIGGKPGHSLYFYGHKGNDLLYLDPHSPVQKAIPPFEPLTQENIDTYHTRRVKTMPITSLDPSLAVGFYIKTADEFRKWQTKCEELARTHRPLFAFAESAPVFIESALKHEPSVVSLPSMGDDDDEDEEIEYVLL
eukprot:TRINITY_DN215_c2_g1_i1.p1 TRINITY_DN215_c2_g1~~TRINITY_DN215_c2_g1_i1.p1  ORF type:complete len:379 (+),score=79.22 TRINITY_DN215_c2_g1_i1:65-1201(+)